MEDERRPQYWRMPSDSYDMAPLRNPSIPQVARPGHSRQNSSSLTSPVTPTSASTIKRKPLGGQPYMAVSPSEGQGDDLRPKPNTMESYDSAISDDTIYSRDSRTSDDIRLLGPYSQSRNAPFRPTPYDPAPVSNQSRIFWWWNPAWLMYIFFAVGIAGAFAHHFFYASLAGREAKDQLKMLRYGAALAYLTKACLIACVILAYRQQIWATFRRKLLTVTTIDSLFAATEDVSALFNLEVFLKAKVGMFMVAIVWITPLVAILTPATLNVEPSTVVNVTTCSSIRTLNFTPESTNNWRTPTRFDGLPELSLSLWNTTSLNVSDPNWFDYYTSPSPPAQQMATLSSYLKRIITRENASLEICGSGWNCSFDISFTAPGYKCSEQAKGRNDNTEGLAGMDAPFNTNMLVPDGNYSYFALTYLGDYSPEQVDSGSAGIPNADPPYPPHLGAFRTEPVLWIGHSDLADTNRPIPQNAADPDWSSAFTPTIFSCEHYITNYTVQFNYTSGQQVTKILNRTYLEPVIDTKFLPNSPVNDSTKDTTAATPESNYVLPNPVEKYRLTGAYHSLGALFRFFLNGTVDFQHSDAPITFTEATKTRLTDPRTYLAVPDLMDQVQSFYEDLILSLFSNPQFLVVAWANDSSKLSGPSPTPSSAADTTNTGGEYPCFKSRTMNQYVYHASSLWLVYGLAILLAAASVCFGAAALTQNAGRSRTTRFSSIAAATRGPGIEKLGWRKDSRWGHVPAEVLEAKLGYGQVANGDSVSYGFGIEGEVRQAAENTGKRGSVLSFQRWDSK